MTRQSHDPREERHTPRKRWGQNFLRNRGAVERIVEALDPQSCSLILEIGPGEGVLTERLVESGVRVRAIEIDPVLSARLGARFGDWLEIIEGDATESPLPIESFCAVGNLPYNVATPIIRRLLPSEMWQRAVFMVQKEVADRIVARTDDDAYGFLSLFVEIYASARIVMTLDPGSFFPRPKVRSAVVRFDRHPASIQSDARSLIDLISASFRMRRKKLVNNLTSWTQVSREVILEGMTRAGIDEHARAEQLRLVEFDQLNQALGTAQR